MNSLIRLFFTFSSVSFFLIVYLVQSKINPLACLLGEYKWVTYLIYLSLPFLSTFISILLSKLLAKSSIRKINSIEPCNNDFLANYLAFFFVALSIKDTITFFAVFGMILLFAFYSQVSYFNPVFLVFGFNFYYVHTNENVKIMLISKKKLKDPQSFEPISAGRINDYTFMEA